MNRRGTFSGPRWRRTASFPDATALQASAATPPNPSTGGRRTASFSDATALQASAATPNPSTGGRRTASFPDATALQASAATPNPPIREIREIRGQNNAAITRPVTVGMNVTAPAVIAQRDISYVMDCVREGRFESKDLRGLITTIRGLGERQAGIANGMKRSLPWFSGSTFNQRRANDRFKAAWFMVFDIDHVEDIPGLKAKAVEKLAYVRYAFQSVRDGVKLVAEFSSPITREEDFRAIWKYLALYIEHTLKVTVDATPDPARACFLSYDPDLLTNPRCRPLDVKQTLREAEASADLMRISRPARTGAADVLVCHENGAADVLVCHENGAADVPNNGAADVLVCHENGAADVPNNGAADVPNNGAADVLVCHENGAADVPNNGAADVLVCHENGAADVLVCHENGAADVLVCQSPEGACEGKDKLLRSFANGDVCGSDARGDGVRHPTNTALQASAATPNPPIREIREIRGQSLLDPAPTTSPPHHATTHPVVHARKLAGLQDSTPPNPLCVSASPRLCVKKEASHA